MKRRAILATTFAVAVMSVRSVTAQGTRTAFRIGWITAQRAPSLAPYVAAFRAALADRGYVEGRNLQIDFRYGDDSQQRVPELAAELVRLPVDVILAQGVAALLVSKLALKVPILYVFSGDPIAAGFAETLAHPRNNMTGLTLMAAEFNGKRLELLREIMPSLRRVAVIANPEHPGEQRERAEVAKAGDRLGLEIRYFPTRTHEELIAAFATMKEEPPQAMLVVADGFAVQNRQAIIDFATGLRAPVISGWPVFAESGALCTYGPRLIDSYRRLAYFVDRIANGAKPADLPVEQPATFDMVLNLTAANALGLTVPQSILLRADRIIPRA